jgi:hypothetical protein
MHKGEGPKNEPRMEEQPQAAVLRCQSRLSTLPTPTPSLLTPAMPIPPIPTSIFPPPLPPPPPPPPPPLIPILISMLPLPCPPTPNEEDDTLGDRLTPPPPFVEEGMECRSLLPPPGPPKPPLPPPRSHESLGLPVCALCGALLKSSNQSPPPPPEDAAGGGGAVGGPIMVLLAQFNTR